MSRTRLDNRNELAVVEHLASCLEHRLADRGGSRHAPGWEPKQNVVLGVLEPRLLRTKTDDGDASRTSTEAQAPEDDLGEGDSTPSVGMDFVVETYLNQIEVEVDADFALYLEEYPSLAEQRDYLTPEASEWDEDGEDGDGSSGRPSRNTGIVSVWRRYDVALRHARLSVPLGGEHVKVVDALRVLVKETVDRHFERPEAAREFAKRTRTVSVASLKSPEEFRRALAEAENAAFKPEYSTLALSGFAESLGSGHHLVSISLTNETVVPNRPFQDLSVYDCRLRIRVLGEASVVPQRFTLAPVDYRYTDLAAVIGHGRGCVVVEEEGALATTTLPRYVQRVVEPRTDHVPALRWDALADDPAPILDAVEQAMQPYLEQWDFFLRSLDGQVREASGRERGCFEDEIRRFRAGRRAMARDPRLAQAFRMANGVFAELNAERSYDSWRLFQLVFVVSHLPALAAREHREDQELLQELEFADVLWFPTGGGKTEAYLGLITTALFYDRLRGKAHGITAWLKFPLRMLSVQQLSRVLRLLVVADRWRRDKLEEGGDPFQLGYLVGSSNTPNGLLWPRSWWPGIEAAASWTPEDLDDFKLVAQCPYCGEKKVILRADKEAVRLFHTCVVCERDLPLVMSDDEIYRYMPAVLVGTIDKLSGFAFFGEYTQFSHGPRWRCPDHGWFTFPRQDRCLAGNLCKRSRVDWQSVGGWYDPVPAIVLQDELHLVREELGAFDAHYEGLMAEVQQSSPSGLPSKILAASATIEQFEDQLRQVYGRRPRSFPTFGFERVRGFYTVQTDDAQRVYLGVLPHYRRKADVAAIVQRELVLAVADLQDTPASEALDKLGLKKIAEGDVSSLLFNYEVSLAYVNNKSHGDLIEDELARLSKLLEDRGRDRILIRKLTGEVRVPELADAIERIERDSLDQPRSERLRALVGTSVVSHGVDLERLNAMVMTGLPATVADYIQATSRSGRVHAGLVVTVFDSFQRRERSSFVNFVSFHRFLDRMVEPVPVNKFARFGADRTLPGIVVALLWDLCRDQALSPPEDGIRYSRALRRWWNTHAAQLMPILRDRIEACYRSPVPGVNEANLEDELASRVVERWETIEVKKMEAFDADRTTDLFRERVLSSFRDIDSPAYFDALTWSAQAYRALTGHEPDGERGAADVAAESA